MTSTPVDSRITTPLKSDLISSNIFFKYTGMIVSVTSESNPDDNGLYLLKYNDGSTLTDWEQLASTLVAQGAQGVPSVSGHGGKVLRVAASSGTEWVSPSDLGIIPSIAGNGGKVLRVHASSGTEWVSPSDLSVSPTNIQFTTMGLLNTGGSNTFEVGTTTNIPLLFKTSNIVRMLITGDGKVGIGTNDPKSALHVTGLIDSTPDTKGVHLGMNSTLSDSIIELCSSGTSLIDFTEVGVDRKGRIKYTHSDDKLAFEVNGTTSVTITSSGMDLTGTLRMYNGSGKQYTFPNSVGTAGQVLTFPSSGDLLEWADGSSLNLNTAGTGTGLDADSQLKISDGETTNPQYLKLGVNRASTYSYIQSTKAQVHRELALNPLGGNVGIGTTSPLMKLDVAGSIRLGSWADTSRFVGLTGTNNANFISGMEIESVSVVGNYSQNIHLRSHHHSTSEGRRLTVQYDGNVGIGTTTPDEKLHIDGGNIKISGTSGIGLVLNGTSASANWKLLPSTGITTKMFRIYDNDNSVDRLVIDSVGKVGIGTITPTELLHIHGGNIKITGTHNVTINSDKIEKTGNSPYTIGTFHNQSLIFKTSNATRMTINGAGNVGFGDITPLTRFQVGEMTNYGSFSWDSDAAIISCETKTSNSALNDPETALYLTRQGTSSLSYGAMAAFKLSRYEDSGTDSRTRFDINLAHGSFDDINVLTALSSGNVGIGTITPESPLHIRGDIAQHPTEAGVHIGEYTNQVWMIMSPSHNDSSCHIQFRRKGHTQYYGRIMYNFTDQSLSFRVNNVERMIIDSVGNVGIGTTTPDCKLTIQTTGEGTGTDTSSQLRIQDDEGTNPQYLKIGVNSTNNYSYIQSTQANVAANTISLNPLGGNVGIGTTNPQAKLHVEGGAGLTVRNGLTVGTTIKSTGLYGPPTQNTHIVSGANGDNEGLFIKNTYNNSTIDFISCVRQSGIFNIGIHNNNPTHRFQVSNTTTAMKCYLSCVALIGAENNTSSTNGANWATFAHASMVSDNNYALSQHSTGQTRINCASGKSIRFISAQAERMRMTSDGNFGIGHAAPLQKLHVEGNILLNAYSSTNGGGTQGIFFRPDTMNYNLSILTYAHTGTTADGLSINGYDGVSFCTGSNSRQERMRIAGDGIVSIAGSDTSTTPVLSLRNGTGQTSYSNGAQISFGFNGSDSYNHFICSRHNSGAGNRNAIDFYTCDSTSNNTLSSGSIHGMTITNGKVGIGKIEPTTALDVDGDINCNVINTSGDVNLALGKRVMLGQNVTDTNSHAAGIYWHTSTDYAITRTAGAWSAPDYQQLSIKWGTGIILDINGSNFDRSFVDVKGKLGVNVSSKPSTQFEVNGDSRFTGKLEAYNASAEEGFQALVTNGTQWTKYGWRNITKDGTGDENQSNNHLTINNKKNSAIDFMTRNTLRMRIDNDGFLGVGEEDPANKIDIKYHARTGTHPTGRSLYATNDNIPIAEFRHSNGTQGIRIDYNTIGSIGTNADVILNVVSQGTGNHYYKVGSQTAMFIDGSTRYISVGTHTPSKNLDVAGDINFTGTLYKNGTQFSYNDLTNRPTIPTALSDLTNDIMTTTSNLAVNEVIAGIGNGRAKIGSLHNNGWGGFAQINRFNDSDYAIIQNNNGVTFLNAKSGEYIGFRINNQDRMRMLANGYFGIGTNTPATKLHVVGDINFTGTLYKNGTQFSYNDLTNKPSLFSGSYNDLTNRPTIPTALSDLTNDIMTTTSNISVNKITANNAVEIGDGLTVYDQNNTTGGIRMRSSTLASPGNHWVDIGYSGITMDDNDRNNVHFTLNQKCNTDIVIKTNNAERMRIKNDGRVGIGINNPGASLHIYGNISDTQMFLGSEGNNNKAALLKYFQGTTTTNTGAEGDGRLCIGHWGDAVNTGQGLNIKKGGKVGIGTKDPESSLQVVGDIKCSGSFLYSSNTLSASSSTAPSGLFFAALSANSNNIELSQNSGEKTTRNDTANPLPLRWNVATSNASSVSQWGRNNVGKGTIDLNTYDLIGHNVTTQSLNDGTCVHVKVTGIYEISFAIPVFSNKYRTNPCISVGIVTNPHTATNGTYNDTRMFASNGYIRADSGNNICMMILSPIILQINENQGIQVYGRRIASWGRDERAKVRTNSTGVGYLFVKRIA